MTFDLVPSPSFWIGAFCGFVSLMAVFFMMGSLAARRGAVASISPTTFAKLFGYDDDQRVAMLCPWSGPEGAWQIRVFACDPSTGCVQYAPLNFEATEEGIANARMAFSAFMEKDAFALDAAKAHWISNFEQPSRSPWADAIAHNQAH